MPIWLIVAAVLGGGYWFWKQHSTGASGSPQSPDYSAGYTQGQIDGSAARAAGKTWDPNTYPGNVSALYAYGFQVDPSGNPRSADYVNGYEMGFAAGYG